MDSSMSTRSPNVYPNAGPLEMADATADLRKSMASVVQEKLHVREAKNVVGGDSRAGACLHVAFLFRASRGSSKVPQPSPIAREHRVSSQVPSSQACCYSVCS